MKKKMVVLTGAGVSAESGIQTFRDGDGLWENYRIEDVATPEAWDNNAQLVLDFYNMRRKQVMQAQPNEAHHLLAQLQDQFDVQIITQNIDDLHERAGSHHVLHLHGEILKKRCTIQSDCVETAEEKMSLSQTPHGGMWRPHIVWFGEEVPMLEQAIQLTEQADIFLVIGTSLLVYPAASLVQFTAKHAQTWIIDPKIPAHLPASFKTIAQPATTGMREYVNLISANKFL
ncbi:MAG: NAD-dependent deacetylase [Bacteroidota bacterium]